MARARARARARPSSKDKGRPPASLDYPTSFPGYELYMNSK